LAATLAVPNAAQAEEASAPDSARIAWVRFALQQFDDVRVVTHGAKLLTHDPGVFSEGVRLGVESGGWGVVSRPLSKERVVPWAEVESIQGRRGSSGLGGVFGGLTGLSIGLLIVSIDSFSHASIFGDSKDVSGMPIVIGLVGGAALGAAIDRPRPWQSVYP
jgi:hypothetical protein